jgi:large subunit ribosomal protein L18
LAPEQAPSKGVFDLNSKTLNRQKRHKRLRKKISGTGNMPRLAVFRSLANIYSQLIDDTIGKTIISVSSLTPELRNEKAKKSEKAKAVGKMLAEKAKAKGIEKVVFDRCGYRYHGRVKALADGAREGGLKF